MIPNIEPAAIKTLVRSLVSGEDSNLFVVRLDAAARVRFATKHNDSGDDDDDDDEFILKKQVIRSAQSIPRFLHEVELLQRIAAKPTQHVVLPLAFVQTPPDFAQLLPFAQYGDLRAFSSRADLSPTHIVSLAVDMCAAVHELHAKARLVHRDVKSANFLVFAGDNDSLVARLTDYGSARAIDVSGAPVPEAAGPSRGWHKKRLRGTTTVFAAPEVLAASSDDVAASCDVFSLGVALAELATGLVPYSCSVKESPALNTVVDASYSEAALVQEIHAGLRPLDSATARARLSARLGEALASDFAALLVQCWAASPLARPSAALVHARMRDVAAAHRVALPCSRVPLVCAALEAPSLSPSSAMHNGGAPEADAIDNQMFYGAQFEVGVYATAGKRGADKMEDASSVTHARVGDGLVTIICVFDGHGGAASALFASKDLAPRLHRAYVQSAWGPALCEAVAECFEASSAAFVRGGDASGTTAVAVIVPTSLEGEIKGQILVANAGDCRVVVGTRGGKARRLTSDHLASTNEGERARVVAAGGSITADAAGKLRVQGLIQVTRSLGDAAVKPFGVTATPETCIMDVGPDEAYLIVASDGMWDALADERAVRLIIDTAQDPTLAANRLGAEALAKGSTDNVTVCVAFMRGAAA